jgi:hypothetical protein
MRLSNYVGRNVLLWLTLAFEMMFMIEFLLEYCVINIYHSEYIFSSSLPKYSSG